MSPSDDVVISVHGLTKQYRGSVLAADHVDFSVARGSVCGMLGPNGAGKTTTLRMLVGLVRPSAGEARLLGERVRPGHPVLERVGTMIEEATFVPYLSGITNLRLYWEAGGGAWGDANLDEALAVAGLGDAIRRRVKTYSHGMKQRLGIARVLLGRPEVLVLDEPTNGLDPQENRQIRELIRHMADAGTTVLLSSHLLSEIEQVCSHVVVMDQGRLVASGTVADLIASAHSAYLEVDDVLKATRILNGLAAVERVTAEPPGLTVEINGATRSALVAALVDGGVAVDTVTARNRLEEAFLELLGEEGASR